MKVIANGAYDTYIQRFAQDVKAFGKPVILRFAQEMDGGWFPWGDSRYDNTPRLFVKAWRHIVKIFQNEGAGNARFLWNPLSPNVNEGLYPGDAYVSYVGFTFFNWADNSHPWKGMLAGYSGRYAGMRRITSKPIIVAETGSAPDKWGNSRAAWVADGYPAVYAKLPGIKGIIYFSVDMSQDTHPPQPNWMLEGQSLNEYKLLVNQPRFKGTLK
jgi:beta-mannanase